MGSFKPSGLFPGGPRGDLSVGVLWSWGVRGALLAAEKDECEQRRMWLCLRSSSCVCDHQPEPCGLSRFRRELYPGKMPPHQSPPVLRAWRPEQTDREDIA